MFLPPPTDDLPGRSLLLLLLLAREADLPFEQVDGPAARAVVGRGLSGSPCRYRVRSARPRVWMTRV